MKAQSRERKTEPNSSLGEATQYTQKQWPKLTLFLRVAGAPIDNIICYAVHGIDEDMPRPGLCRVGLPRRTLTDGRYSQAVLTHAA